MDGERIAIMVDGANLAFGVAGVFGRDGRKDAWRRILHHLPDAAKQAGSAGARIVSYDLFLIDAPIYRSIASEVSDLGINVHFVEAPAINEEQRRSGVSRDDDLALNRHALERIEDYDVLLLVSNDGDFVSMVQTLRGDGRHVVVGFLETKRAKSPKVVASRELKAAASAVLELRLLAEREIAMPKPPKAAESAGPPTFELYQGDRPLGSYTVSGSVFEVGRSSKRRKTKPDLDLADEDTDQVTSRHHLALRFLSRGRCLVQIHVDCSSRTWLNENAMLPGEWGLFRPGDELVLGHDEEGFRLVFATPDKD